MAKNSPQEMMNRQHFSSQLNQLLKAHHKKQVDLHRDLHIPKSTLTGYVKGTSLPNTKNLQKIADYFNVSPSDLDLRFAHFESNKTTAHTKKAIDITQIIKSIIDTSTQLHEKRQQHVLNYAKEQLKEQNNTIIQFSDIKESTSTYPTATEYSDIHLYGLISAGTGLDLYDEIIETIRYPKPIPKHDIALRVQGNSMEPMFRDEEIVFIKKTQDIHHGQIGAFIVNGMGFLKKFYREKNSIRLVSLNREYQDIIISEYDDIRLVGTVVL